MNDRFILVLKNHNSGNKVEQEEKQINREAGSQKASKTQLKPKQGHDNIHAGKEKWNTN